jgi:SAM-dependent methyltransferase
MFDSYALFYDIFNSDKSYKQEIDFVYKWAKKPNSLLDIGCGTADYWKYLPDSLRLVGIESSLSMIERSEHKNLIICADITRGINWNKKNNSIFDSVTALFDVINYIPRHGWWKNIPVKKGGYFIFDIWDTKKIQKEGFRVTSKSVENHIRTITPIGLGSYKKHESFFSNDYVDLEIRVDEEFHDPYTGVSLTKDVLKETHRMYLYSDDDIANFCGKEFTIVDSKSTGTWQKWYKLKRE